MFTIFHITLQAVSNHLFVFVSSTGRKYDINDKAAFDLWRSFNTVIILDDNVRFQLDAEWGHGCQQARRGNWTPEFIDLINDHVLPPCASLKWLNPQINAAFESVRQVLDGARDETGQITRKTTQFVTPDNETRTLINNEYIARAAASLPRGHYPIRVVADFHHALNGLSTEDISRVMSMSDSRTGRLASYLDLIPGMPIVFTQNVNADLGIANGTFGNLYDVQFPQDVLFKLVEDAGTGLKVLMANKPPSIVFVSVNRDNYTTRMPLTADSTLPDNLFPVFMHHVTRSVDVHLTPAVGGNKRSISVQLTQFPFICAAGSTIYKIQGETLTSMVVADWKALSRPGVRKPNQRQQAYIAVSRVTQRSAFAAMTPFTAQHARWFQPDQACLDEDLRLNVLCNQLLTLPDIVLLLPDVSINM